MAHQEPPAASGSSRAMSAAVTSSRQDHQRATRPHASHEAALPLPDVASHPALIAWRANHPNRPVPKFGSYYMLQTLGEGEFGKVKLGIHTKYGEETAVKLIRKDAVENEARMAKIAREIEILDTLKHPNIVRLYDVFETDKFFGIILEFASGGELFDHILAHRYLRERDASKLFAQLISGVWYMHEKGIVHRDLKLENLLLDRSRNLIITDFGFSNHFSRGGGRDALLETMCGSPCYAAPELVNAEGNYVGTAADIWSCGVILYAMLSGYLPFDDDPTNPEGEDINKLYKYIATTELTFPEQISDDACSLLSIMLVPNPAKRADLGTVMRHRWFAANLREATTFGLTVKELEKLADEGASVGGRAYRRRKEKPEEKKKGKAKEKEAPREERRSRSKRSDGRETGDSSPSRAGGDHDASGRSVTASPLQDLAVGDTPRKRRVEQSEGGHRERARHTIDVGHRERRERSSPVRGTNGRSTAAPLQVVHDGAELNGAAPEPPPKDRQRRVGRQSGHTTTPNVRTVFLSPVLPSSSLESTTETSESTPHYRATTEIPNVARVNGHPRPIDLASSTRSRPTRTQSDAAQDTISRAHARAHLPPLVIDSSSSSESKPPTTPLNATEGGLPIPMSASPSKPNKVMQWFRKGRRTTVSAGIGGDAAASSVEVSTIPHTPVPVTPPQTKTAHTQSPASASPFLVTPGTTEHRHRTSSAVSITSLFRRSAGVSAGRSAMRVHHGAVDNEMITAGRPVDVMKHLWDVCAGMGVDIQVEGDFKYRCTRPARRTGREREKRDAGGGETTGLRGLLSRRLPSPARSIAEKSMITPSAAPIPQVDAVYGHQQEDTGDEVRFSVELTRLDRLKDMYSVDIRRMKGNLKSYKFLYDTFRGRVDLQT